MNPIAQAAVPTWALELGCGALADPLAQRWRHCLGVAAAATRLQRLFGPGDAPLLAAAAVLHDVGYAPPLIQTGFPAVDGARFLAALGVEDSIVSLVAHHSCADTEAELRGLSAAMGEFPAHPDRSLVDALAYSDMTTSPVGDPVSVEVRLADIVGRYGPTSVVGRFVARAGADLRASVARVEHRLEASTAPRALRWTPDARA